MSAQAETERARAHVRALTEAEQVERWADLVQQYGANVVETVIKHADAGFELPARLRPQPKAQKLPFEE